MTKKISKKNLLCLFPPKAGKLKIHESNKLKQYTKQSAQQFTKQSGKGSTKGSEKEFAKGSAKLFSKESTSASAEMDYADAPDCTSDWQAHYDYLEMGPWGSALFGAPLDRRIEEMAWRALQLAFESGDKDKIAKSYRHLFYLYCEFNHPDSLTVGIKSVVAAVDAYGHSTAEVGEEVAMLAVVHEFNNNHDQAIAARDATIKIFQKGGTTGRLFEALENAICCASDMGRGDKVEEYARHGIRLVSERCNEGSDEYIEYMEYFEQMLESAHEPPVPIEVQQQQLLSMFPNLKKMFEVRN